MKFGRDEEAIRNLSPELLRHRCPERRIMLPGVRPTCSCDRPYRKHIAPLLRCTDPRGATSCGSRKPRGEQIAKPAEQRTRLAGPFFPASHGMEQLALDTPSSSRGVQVVAIARDL